MMYPADYGFIPETLALDGDPLDVLVLVTEPTFPGCVMEVKPIGVFHMADDKGQMKSNLCTGIRSNMEFIRKLIRYPTLIKEIEFLSSVQRP
jgi:inorganic pyrophosphatase